MAKVNPNFVRKEFTNHILRKRTANEIFKGNMLFLKVNCLRGIIVSEMRFVGRTHEATTLTKNESKNIDFNQ